MAGRNGKGEKSGMGGGKWDGLNVYKGPACLLIATKKGDKQKCVELEGGSICVGNKGQ